MIECPVRKAFLVYVDLDPIPGVFHTAGSAYIHLQGILDNHIRYHRPVVVWANTNAEQPRKRACFVVFVNLDSESGGVFSNPESVENLIQNLFLSRIKHYNPMVSLAPDFIQPENLLKGKIDA